MSLLICWSSNTAAQPKLVGLHPVGLQKVHLALFGATGTTSALNTMKVVSSSQYAPPSQWPKKFVCIPTTFHIMDDLHYALSDLPTANAYAWYSQAILPTGLDRSLQPTCSLKIFCRTVMRQLLGSTMNLSYVSASMNSIRLSKPASISGLSLTRSPTQSIMYVTQIQKNPNSCIVPSADGDSTTAVTLSLSQLCPTSPNFLTP